MHRPRLFMLLALAVVTIPKVSAEYFWTGKEWKWQESEGNENIFFLIDKIVNCRSFFFIIYRWNIDSATATTTLSDDEDTTEGITRNMLKNEATARPMNKNILDDYLESLETETDQGTNT